MPETSVLTAFAVIFPLGVLTILSAFHFLLFLSYREEKYNLYFMFLALTLAVNDATSGIPTLISLSSETQGWFKFCFRLSATLSGLTTLLAVYAPLQEKIPLVFYRLMLPVLSVSLLNALFPNQWSPIISFVIVSFLIVEICRIAYQALSRSLIGAYIIGFGTLSFVCISLFYWLTILLNVRLNAIETVFFTLSDMLIMPVTMALWTSVRFASTYHALEHQAIEIRTLSEAMIENELVQRELIEQQNYELERLVNERTAQLQEKMNLLASANEEIQRQVEIQAQQSAEIQFANARLQEQNERLNTLNQEKNELLGVVAHDLKNPLGNIMMLTEMVRGTTVELDEERKNEAVAQILLTSKKMHRLIENLLDINKIEQGNVSMQLIILDFAAKIRLVTDDFSTQAFQKNISIETQLPESAMIRADSVAIGQVIENIVSNAVKYTFPGKKVCISLQEFSALHPTTDEFNDIKYRFIVEDEGPGLPKEELPLLFGKFVRLSAQPTAGEHSTGLGLSIVKRLVEAMNGRVWCESTLGIGSRFIVEFAKAI